MQVCAAKNGARAVITLTVACVFAAMTGGALGILAADWLDAARVRR